MADQRSAGRDTFVNRLWRRFAEPSRYQKRLAELERELNEQLRFYQEQAASAREYRAVWASDEDCLRQLAPTPLGRTNADLRSTNALRRVLEQQEEIAKSLSRAQAARDRAAALNAFRAASGPLSGTSGAVRAARFGASTAFDTSGLDALGSLHRALSGPATVQDALRADYLKVARAFRSNTQQALGSAAEETGSDTLSAAIDDDRG